MVKGFQWFRFTFREAQPKLVYFVLNVTDRDVPYDVDIFQAGKDAAGQPDVVPFTDGRVRLSGRGDAELSGPLQVPHAHSSARAGILRPRRRESSCLSVAHVSIPRAAE